jgi:hypothetical protein
MTTIAAERVTNPASGAAKARERPILFSSEMVKAILDGRKTMTRRVVKEQPELSDDGNRWRWKGKELGTDRPLRWILTCPFGQSGDRLWVRESFWAVEVEDQGIGNQFLVYDEEFVGPNPRPKELRPTLQSLRWGHHPSIHMPRWASRITLEITAVRVERVQDISEGDAKAEGLQDWYGAEPAVTNRGRFHAFWDSLNAKRGYEWDANPWAWVITFRRLP